MAQKDIKLEDGYWNNYGAGWKVNQPDTIIGNSDTIKKYKQMFEIDMEVKYKKMEEQYMKTVMGDAQMSKMTQIMKDVKTSVEASWPGVQCNIHQSFDAPTWGITLSKMAGGQVCYVQQYVTDSALHPLSDTSKGIWIIQEVISKMIKTLEKTVEEQLAKQPPMNLYGIPEAVQTSAPTQSSFQPKYYEIPLSAYEDIFSKIESKSPKMESLEDMYDNAPVEVKKKKKVKTQKLTAAETVQLKKQIKLGIPKDLSLKQAKAIHEALSEKYTSEWMHILEPTEEVKAEVKAIVDAACVKPTALDLSKVMGEKLKGLADKLFKDDPMLSYLKSPQKIKMSITKDAGMQGGVELKEEPMYLTNWELTKMAKKP